MEEIVSHGVSKSLGPEPDSNPRCWLQLSEVKWVSHSLGPIPRHFKCMTLNCCNSTQIVTKLAILFREAVRMAGVRNGNVNLRLYLLRIGLNCHLGGRKMEGFALNVNPATCGLWMIDASTWSRSQWGVVLIATLYDEGELQGHLEQLLVQMQ